MKLNHLINYKLFLWNYQDSCCVWITENNQVLDICFEDTHYSYLKEKYNKNICFEWPFERSWVKITNTKFGVEIFGDQKRICQTKKLWLPVLESRIINESFDLSFCFIDDQYKTKTREKTRINQKSDLNEFLLGRIF